MQTKNPARCKQNKSARCKQNHSAHCKQNKSACCKQNKFTRCKQNKSAHCKQNKSAHRKQNQFAHCKQNKSAHCKQNKKFCARRLMRSTGTESCFENNMASNKNDATLEKELSMAVCTVDLKESSVNITSTEA